ncbi:MAG: hypothetical protein Q8N31_26800 [Reyranella sp.]|nr:hypothetical protein [Reyranella sp.]MDP3163640.1 hypothetical protein [Reyranella sp.]
MTTGYALGGVAVGNLDSAISWYARLLGRQPDLQPVKEVAEWEFSGGGWIQHLKFAGNNCGNSPETAAFSR